MPAALEVVPAGCVGWERVTRIFQDPPGGVETGEQELAVAPIPHVTVGAGVDQHHLKNTTHIT